MAPTRKRSSIRSRIASKPTKIPSIHSSATALEALKADYSLSSSFPSNKRDKRIIKHGNLLARVREGGITKSSSASAIGDGSGGKKRRRPGKKLRTDISTLGDALPDIDEDGEEDVEEEWEGVSDGSAEGGTVRRRRRRRNITTMVMKSLTHRAGAMKRKGEMERREKERFGKNLAQLAAGGREIAGGEETSDEAKKTEKKKWQALRAFIGQTLQRDQAFEGRWRV